jgi:hypothetical protein
MSKNIKERIAELKNEQMQLKARAQTLQSKFNKSEKAANDKRKIVLGSMILKDIESHEAARRYVVKLIGTMRDRDQQLFSDLLQPIVKTSIEN